VFRIFKVGPSVPAGFKLGRPYVLMADADDRWPMTDE
jgi:hypothetical protein